MSIELKNHVDNIESMLSNGFPEDELNFDGDPYSAFDYLAEALDIEYIIDRDRNYLGARVLVSFGGPNIWINTRTKTVEGYWWSDKYSTGYIDNIGLDDAIRELYECN